MGTVSLDKANVIRKQAVAKSHSDMVRGEESGINHHDGENHDAWFRSAVQSVNLEKLSLAKFGFVHVTSSWKFIMLWNGERRDRVWKLGDD